MVVRFVDIGCIVDHLWLPIAASSVDIVDIVDNLFLEMVIRFVDAGGMVDITV
jgi:hypothetical protein